MQFWEALIYKKIMCNLISNLAMITNLLQPFQLLILLPLFIRNNKDDENLYLKIFVIIILLLIYTIYVSIYSIKDYKCILTESGVELKWWSGNYGGEIYIIVMIIMFRILVNDNFIAYGQILFLLSSLLVSKLFYKEKSRIGSVWCFFAAFSPIFNYLLFKYSIEYN